MKVFKCEWTVTSRDFSLRVSHYCVTLFLNFLSLTARWFWKRSSSIHQFHILSFLRLFFFPFYNITLLSQYIHTFVHFNGLSWYIRWFSYEKTLEWLLLAICSVFYRNRIENLIKKQSRFSFWIFQNSQHY